MSPDPEARRDTPLGRKLSARIRQSGPMPVRDYMHACLNDGEHGYYRTRAPIGAGGDFITAPEIAQVFGELIGLWAVVAWQQMGRPAPFDLIELGPGRGTLMADALRAARLAPEFLEAARPRLVEGSEVLRRAQETRLRDAAIEPEWLETFPPLDAPTLLIANEFLDTGPVWQRVLTENGWMTRAVGLDRDGRLQFTTIESGDADALMRERWPDAPVGAIDEEPDWAIVDWLATALHAGEAPPFAALLIDYGHTESGLGDTLQAVRGHAHEHPLTSPGEADLSIQVNFAWLVRQIEKLGLAVDGPLTQAELLGRLGIVERASRLMAANPAEAAGIEAGVARLLAPGGMGTRFKAIGLRSPRLPVLPGF
jgi:SAM-dependent MidA family methyltransferase